MKYPIFLLAFIIFAVAVQAQQPEQKKQTLKDLLYSGKLKKDSSGVIRSTDDLSTKIDTTTKKPVEPEKPKPTATTSEPTKQAATTTIDPRPTGVTTPNDAATTIITTTAATTEAVAAPPKSNTKLWKEYTDSLTSYLKAEVWNSKQLKKATYFMIFDYEIDVDGKVAILNVTSTPENSFLQAQVKQFLDSTPFQLSPVLDSAGQPRKVKRKQSYTLTKD